MGYHLYEPTEDDRRVIARCSFCGDEIHAGNDRLYGDEAYFAYDTWCCYRVDCQVKFMDKLKVQEY